jgi:anti-anti-sigma regulatory factor
MPESEEPMLARTGPFPDEARFTVESEGDDLVLRVAGPLRPASSTELLRRLRVLANLAAGGRLIIELGGATLVGPSAIETLTRAQRACAEVGVPLSLRNPSPEYEAALTNASPPFDIEHQRTRSDDVLGH